MTEMFCRRARGIAKLYGRGRLGDEWYFVRSMKTGRHLFNIPGSTLQEAHERASDYIGLRTERLRLEKIGFPIGGHPCPKEGSPMKVRPVTTVMKPRPVVREEPSRDRRKIGFFD